MPDPNESQIDDTLSNVTEALLKGQGFELSNDQPDEDPPEDQETPAETPGEHHEDPPQEDPTDDPAPDEDQPLPGTVKQLAERLGVKPGDIYKALKIDLDGVEVSLGEFKDRAKELHRVDVLLAEAESHRTASQNETLRQSRALSIAMARLGRALTPGEVAQADEQHNEYLKGENQKTLNVISEWSDATVQSSELKAIGKLLIEYGLSPAEIQGVADHRQIKILNDFARLRSRMKSASDSVQRKKGSKPGKARRRTADKPIERAKAAHKAGDLSDNAMILSLIADGARK